MIRKIFGALFLLMAFVFTASAQDQAAKDETILKDYFAKYHIKAKRTASGLYYVIHKKGSGVNAKPGDQVGLNYYGHFLDGKKFDSNVDEQGNPVPGRSLLTFTLGTGAVIQGWEEGIALLNKGCKATLYLPSGLAYGPSGRGALIPPNSILVFDVALLNID